MSKTKPMIFNGEMVRAILEERKTQTRRVIKPQIDWLMKYPKSVNVEKWVNHQNNTWWGMPNHIEDSDPSPAHFCIVKCPYGRPGDQLWVRETFQYLNFFKYNGIGYRADGGLKEFQKDFIQFPSSLVDIDDLVYNDTPWRPSIYMPRWASRIDLEITNVRVERVQGIPIDNITDEGVGIPDWDTADVLLAKWIKLWDSINAKRGYSWDVNPWVWVINFRKV